MKPSIKLENAQKISEALVKLLEPYTEKAIVAGSIRRQVETVGDIELVVIPKLSTEPPLLRDAGSIIDFYEWAATQTFLDWVKPGVAQIERKWPVKAGAKYLRGMFSDSDDNGLKIDIFIANRDNFGIIATIRTGSNFFTQALMTRALRIKKRCQKGYLTEPEGKPIKTPEEIDVFNELDLKWINPIERIPKTLGDAHQLVADLRL